MALGFNIKNFRDLQEEVTELKELNNRLTSELALVTSELERARNQGTGGASKPKPRGKRTTNKAA